MIEVSGLTKKYGEHTAVSDLSFAIENGRIYGFLGPNGAGKSTTMNTMTGCLAATEGRVSIDGHDIYEDAVAAKKKIGYLPELPPLYPDMTPAEYLRFVGRMKGLRGAELDAAAVDKVLSSLSGMHAASTGGNAENARSEVLSFVFRRADAAKGYEEMTLTFRGYDSENYLTEFNGWSYMLADKAAVDGLVTSLQSLLG